MRFLSFPLLVAALAAACPAAARSEVFVLHNGGRVEGELLNPDQSPRKEYVVRLAGGGQVTFDAAMVEQKLYQDPAEIEYEKIKPGYPDTVEGQWALAEWCLNNHLVPQRKVHLGRIIQLDPNHAEARRALGFSQINGEWKTQEEVMISRGYRMYKGRWRLPQEIDLMEKKDKEETAEREWFAKVRMWRGWLGTSKDGQARKNFASIDDPSAVRALTTNLENEGAEDVRKLYIEVLARINTADAVTALAERSMVDPVQEVRLTCLDYLKKERRPGVVAYYVGKLKSKDNLVIRRAAVGLAHMDDPSAIGPLIDALVTVHSFKVTTPTFNNSFGTGPGGSGLPGGGGFGFGGGPKIVKRTYYNQEVRDALVSITKGVNYDFNVGAWKAWYSQQKKRGALDARRD